MYAFDVDDGDLVSLTAITADEASLITSICVIIFIIGLLCIPCKYDACYLCVCISTVGFFCGLIAIILWSWCATSHARSAYWTICKFNPTLNLFMVLSMSQTSKTILFRAGYRGTVVTGKDFEH
jgi:hypothetical protein